MEWLLEPLTFEFFRNALVAAVLAGAVCAVIGVYVVLRGMAYLGGALSHAVLPGVAVAYLLNGSLLVGGLVAGILTSVGVGFVGRHRRLKEDTAIGIMLAGAFALGIAIISAVRRYSADLASLLFGNVLAVTTTDLWQIGAAALVVLFSVLFLHRKWTVLAFDPTYAAASGLSVVLLHHALMVLLSITIVAAMQSVGVLLVTSLLITPPATARLSTNRVSTMMVLSVAWGAASAVLGLYVSFYLNIASGAAIVLVSVLLFFMVFLLSPKQGVIGAWFRHRLAERRGVERLRTT